MTRIKTQSAATLLASALVLMLWAPTLGATPSAQARGSQDFVVTSSTSPVLM